MGLDLKILIKKYPNSEYCHDMLVFERDEELFKSIKKLEKENGNLTRVAVKYFDIEGNELKVNENAYGRTLRLVEGRRLYRLLKAHKNRSNQDIEVFLREQHVHCEVYLYWH